MVENLERVECGTYSVFTVQMTSVKVEKLTSQKLGTGQLHTLDYIRVWYVEVLVNAQANWANVNVV